MSENKKVKTIVYHTEIKEKLDYFIKQKKIPNLIFHGPNGSGKRTIVKHFINDIYKNDKEMIKSHVMIVNCAHGKGIKFIRDDLKFFSKTHINTEGNGNFKTIVLSNADKLTIDAQSALRRCIELFSHTTRFIIIVDDKYKLLKPILSRLCEIFVTEPIVNGKVVNLHKYILNNTFKINNQDKKREKLFETCFNEISIQFKNNENNIYITIFDISTKLYEKGYCGLDIMEYIESRNDSDELKKYEMLLTFNKIKKEFRSEKLFISFILNFLLIRSDYNLENISFM